MKLRFALALPLCLLTVNVLALEIDHCPRPENIKNARGVYSATTVSHQGQWVGTASAVRSKGADGFSVEPAKSFNGAVFYSAEAEGVNRGVLGRCMYSTRSGEKLDLYYRPEVRPDLAVKLLDLQNWKLQPASGTGLQTYICRNKSQGGCVFAILE
ncbi:DUF3757 domain-containing protein [Pseudomonas sp. IT-347P]|uniref:DUF3757 domain-containing protein n=1 Tax=Pseudomonas sp. IT-347P TaxID=3026458 RepID=UPI0039DF5A93